MKTYNTASAGGESGGGVGQFLLVLGLLTAAGLAVYHFIIKPNKEKQEEKKEG